MALGPLDNLHMQVPTYQNRWMDTVDDFAKAYEDAYEEFKGVIGEDIDTKKFRMQMLMMAMLVVGGGAAVYFGASAVMNGGVVMKLMDDVSKKCITRAAQLANLSNRRTTMSFIAGTLLGEAGNQISRATLKEIETRSEKFDGKELLTGTPSDVKYVLRKYVRHAAINASNLLLACRDDPLMKKKRQEVGKLRKAATEIFGNKNPEKDYPNPEAAVVQNILKNEFFRPPSNGLGLAELKRRFLLGFHARYILDQDYSRYTATKYCFAFGYATVTDIRTPIAELPSDKMYEGHPRDKSAYHGNWASGTIHRMQLLHKQPGDAVRKNANDTFSAYKEEMRRKHVDHVVRLNNMGTAFYIGRLDHDEMVRAEKMLEEVSIENIRRISQLPRMQHVKAQGK